MVDHPNCGCTSDSAALERVNYVAGRLLTAEDMNLGQTYMLQKMRLHNFATECHWAHVATALPNRGGQPKKGWAPFGNPMVLGRGYRAVVLP